VYLSRCSGRAAKISRNGIDKRLPAVFDPFSVLRIDKTDSPVTQRYFRSTLDLVQIYLEMIDRRIGHKHRPTYLDQ
jgi:hypothetical protein